MEEIGNLFHGFAVVLQPYNMMVMVIGIVLGVIIGVLPGLGGANGVAILLPLTFTMSPTSAIIMLSCIYWGALFGGAITSILFNIPGEPWSVATTFDGYPMAQQGKAGEALTAAFTSSFVGALFAVIMITLVAPLVASFALQFGPAEKFAVYFLAFCSFVGLSKEPPFKTIASMMIGFALAAVGLDQVTGQLRLTFGFTELLTGFDFLIAVIGLFGIGEILLTMEEGLSFRGRNAKINPKVVLQTWKELPRYWMTSLRSCMIGCWMGITPGRRDAGLVHELRHRQAHLEERRQVRHRRDRRRGGAGDRGACGRHRGAAADARARRAGLADRGGVARRAADLGPAARTDAVRRTEGIRLGPDRLDVSRQHRRPDHRADLRAAVRRDPAHPVQRSSRRSSSCCARSAPTRCTTAFDVVLMLVFGVVGYVLKKCNYPLAPLVLAIVLGDKAEEAFRQSLLASQGGLGVFFSNGLVRTIMVLGLIALFWPIIQNGWTRLRARDRRLEPDAAELQFQTHRDTGCWMLWNICIPESQVSFDSLRKSRDS